MPTREHSVIVDPTHFPGAINDLARILVPLIGQPSSTIITRLERGEITIESDLSQIGADALVDRLSKMGVTANAQNQQNLIDIDLDLPSDFDLDAIFLPDEELLPIPVQPDAPVESNPWQTLFPDLEKEQPVIKADTKKKIPSLGDLETQRVAPQTIVPIAPPRVREAPRPVENMMRDIIPNVEKPAFYPNGFDDKYEHSPQLASIFSLLAPGAGQRYNGEDDRARSIVLSGILIWPWLRSIKQARASAEKIQTYHLKRPAQGAVKRTLIHILMFWLVIGVVLSLAKVGYRQFTQHSELEKSEKTIAIGQISEAIVSARLKHAESRFAGLEAVRAHLAIEPTQEISMTPEEHLERLYAVGVEQCRAKKYPQCQGIMARVSRLKPGYRDVLVLQAWASAQRSAVKHAPTPEISEVKTLGEIETGNQ